MVYTYKSLQEIVEKNIATLPYPSTPDGLYEPIRYILSIGGKRLRPVFLLMSCNLFNDEITDAIPAALALETFHNFTLVHDDIMDCAGMRRGMPTVHTKWNTNVGILSGDTMLIRAYELINQCKPEHLKPVFEIFNRTAIEVCEGQQYDMDFETQSAVTVDEYLKMIDLKTAVLIAASFKIGALIGGANRETYLKLYQIGRDLGMAFQLQDDHLDVYGDAEVFGKNIGGDIASNKKTYLLISALQKAEGNTLAELKNLLQNNATDVKEKISRVTQIYNDLGIREKSAEISNFYINRAIIAFESINLPSEKKQEIAKTLEKLRNRAM